MHGTINTKFNTKMFKELKLIIPLEEIFQLDSTACSAGRKIRSLCNASDHNYSHQI